MRMRLLVVLVGCFFFSSMIPGLTFAADAIKLGANYGMTGRIGWIGGDCVDGAKLVIDEVNAKGGINGKKIDLVVYDSKNNPDSARTNFEKLVKKDKVLAVLGPVVTQASLAVLPLAQKYKVPVAVVSGGIPINAKILPKYKKEGKKCYLWAMSVGTPRQTEAKVLWLKKKGFKKIGVVEPLSEMGDVSAREYKKMAEKNGLEVVATERFDNKGNDFTPQMSKLKAAGADCIGTMASGGPAVTLVKNRDQVGMKKMPMMTSDANLSKKFIKLLGENTADVCTIGPKVSFYKLLADGDPQKKVIADFQQRFEKKFGKAPKSWFFAAVGYDSALMFVKAMQAQGPDGEKMRDWLESQTKFPGAQAVYSWSDLDHRGIGVDQTSIMMIKDGGWVPSK